MTYNNTVLLFHITLPTPCCSIIVLIFLCHVFRLYVAVCLVYHMVYILSLQTGCRSLLYCVCIQSQCQSQSLSQIQYYQSITVCFSNSVMQLQHPPQTLCSIAKVIMGSQQQAMARKQDGYRYWLTKYKNLQESTVNMLYILHKITCMNVCVLCHPVPPSI